MSILWCVEDASTLVSCRTTDGGECALARYRLSEREGSWSLQMMASTQSRQGHAVALQTTLDRSLGVAVTFLVSRRPSSSCLEVHSLSPAPGLSLVPRGTLDGGPDGETDAVLISGPTVVRGEVERVCVALPESGREGFIQREIPLSGFTSGAGHSVERVWAFGCLDDSLLLLIRFSSPAHQGAESTTQWCCLSVRAEGGELEVTSLPSPCHVPRDYGVIATCVSVCHLWRVGREGEVWSELHFVVGTTYRQVVVLRGGIPLHCIAMETTPTELHILQESGEEMVVAVKTADDRVTAYGVVSCDAEPREVGRWGGVAYILVGDFANHSRDQLLLLWTGEKGREVCEFEVTDFSGFTAASETSTEVGVASCQVSDSLVSAGEALRARQKAGEVHLAELERQLQQKSQLLRDSLQLVPSLLTPNLSPPPPRDQSLVCLLPGKPVGENPPGTVPGFESKVGVASDSVAVVTDCWHRILDGHWVVGVVLKNMTNSVWRQVNLSLKIEGLPVIDGGGSWLVWVSSEGEGRRSCLPPASKRPKTQGLQLLERVLGEAGAEKVAKPLRQLLVSHGDQACLVSRAPLPSSLEQWRQASGVLTAGLVVSWRRGTVGMGECEGVEVGRVELPQRLLADPALQCGWQESLELWNGGERMPATLCDFSQRSLQDLACLLATQHIVQLRLTSRYSDLTSLGDTLREGMPLPPRSILPRPRSVPPGNGTGGMELSQETEGLSELGRVCLHVSAQRHTATVSVLHKSPPCLSVVISAIQNCLPDDVALSHPHSPPSPSSQVTSDQTLAMRQCVAALRRELEVKRESVREEMAPSEEETDFAIFRAMHSLGL